MAGFGALVPSEEGHFTSSPKQSVLRDELVKHVSAEAPVFVCLSHDPAAASQRRLDGRPVEASVAFNTLEATPFETPLFKGRVIFNIAGLQPAPKVPPGSDPVQHALNGCQGRAMECVIQGSFKRRIRFDELYTGQSFNKPLRRLPARWLIKATQTVVKSLAPATQLNIVGPKPFLMGPLASIASFFSVSTPPPEGEEPDMFTICEETTLLGGPFADSGSGSMERNARKKFFSNPDNLAKYFFETDLVYSFGFFGDRWRVNECKLDIGVAQIDMAYYLGQAPRVMARLKDSEEYAWAFDLWHRRLLSSNADAAGADHDGEEAQSPHATEAVQEAILSPGAFPPTPSDTAPPPTGLWSWLRRGDTHHP